MTLNTSDLLGLLSLVCAVIILVHAFQNSVWKGIAGLLCWLYLLYYALFEFEHAYKWPIVLCAILFGGASVVTRFLWSL